MGFGDGIGEAIGLLVKLFYAAVVAVVLLSAYIAWDLTSDDSCPPPPNKGQG